MASIDLLEGRGYDVGNPLHDALRDGRETFDVPLLSLTNFQVTYRSGRSLLSYPTQSPVKHWRADLPVCQVGSLGVNSALFSYSGLRTAELSCPLLEDGHWMFMRSYSLESVKLYAPMLKNGK